LAGLKTITTQPLEGANLSIAPNPADEVAVLNYSFPEATDIKIEVRNASGMLVYSASLKGVQTGNHTIDTDRLASGKYRVETSIYGVSANASANAFAKNVQRIMQKIVIIY
jgi:hypothetical protein